MLVLFKLSLCLIRNSSLIFRSVKYQEQNHCILVFFFPLAVPWLDVYSLVARSVLLLNSEHVLCIVLHVCNCGARKDFCKYCSAKTSQDQKNPAPLFRFCSMSVFTNLEICVLQGLQASKSRAEGKIWWFTSILPYPPFSLPLNCFHLRKQNCCTLWKFGSISVIHWKTCYCPCSPRHLSFSLPADGEENFRNTQTFCVYWRKVWHSWHVEEERCHNIPECCTEGECIKIESFVSQAPALTCPGDDGVMHGESPAPS